MKSAGAARHVAAAGASEGMGKTLIVLGLLVAGIGLLVHLGVPLGRLPGDVTVRRGSFTFYAPLMTSAIISLALSLVFFWLRR